MQDWIQFYAKNPAKLQIYKLKPLDTAHLTGCAIVTLKIIEYRNLIAEVRFTSLLELIAI